MGCCSTKEPSAKKKLYEDNKPEQKPNRQDVFESILNVFVSNIQRDDGNRIQTEENKTTINNENKNRNENPGKNDQQSKLSNHTPTPVLNSNIQAGNNSQAVNGSQLQSNLLKEQKLNISNNKENNPDIRKVGSFAVKIDEEAIKKVQQENVDPNSLKGQSQNLSKQQMRISKVDRNTTNDYAQQIAKSGGETDSENINEPVSNMIHYSQQQTFQSKGMKDNILNKHMRSILNSLKTNDYVSKSCYSTPPIPLVDTDSHYKGEWMQVETFGTYGQAEKLENDNFMDD